MNTRPVSTGLVSGLPRASHSPIVEPAGRGLDLFIGEGDNLPSTALMVVD